MKFENPSQEFVYIRTYSRWLEDKKRRETWKETVARYINFIKEERGSIIPDKVYNKMEERILNMEVLPSMRMLWAAGPALKKDNVCGYNCAFANVDSIESFSEALYILMCGTGYGFSVTNKSIEKLPTIPKINWEEKEYHLVEDSREGWANSVKFLLDSLYNGKSVAFDYSIVRPKGSRLLTMGGRSSGPEPLIILHNFIIEIFQTAQGRKLNSLECLDVMNQIASIVVVGGVRRSSQISLSDLDDELIKHAKDWPFPERRRMSNNSAIYYSKPSAPVFLKEWASLAASGTGERGISNLYSSHKNAPKRRNAELIEGYNPCQPANAIVLTPHGITTFANINLGDTIWSGNQWTKITNKVLTGVKPVFRYETTFGQFVGTENHKVVSNGEKVEVQYAESIDWSVGPKASLKYTQLDIQDIMDGLVIGDGSVHKASNNLVYLCIGNKDKDYFTSEIMPLIGKHRSGISKEAYEINTTITSKELPKTYLRIIPDRFYFGNEKTKLGFLRGLFSANGSISDGRVTLKQSSYTLIRQVQEMLSSVGIPSYLTFNKGKEIIFKNGKYKCKSSYDLNITSGKTLFKNSIGFIQTYKQIATTNGEEPKYFTSHIKEVVNLGQEEVFDITVDCKEHTYWTSGSLVSNCHEIALRSKQFCNLSTVVVKERDDLDELLDKVETATWIGAIQSTFTDFPYLSKKWKKNCDEERLLGVSLSGQMDNPELLTVDALKAMKSRAIKIAKKSAEILGINMPTAITCVKPEGTTSQLVNSSSGLHARYSPYYIRRYRIASMDPLFRLLKDSKVPIKPEHGLEKLPESKIHTWVVEFPIKSPKSSVTRDKMSAIEQLEWYKKIQTNWCEHNASATIYCQENDWFNVGNWVYENWDIVCGVSFLPYDGGHYKLAPYEEITKEEYEKLIKDFPKIDYSLLSKYEMEDNTEGAKSYSCVGDRCEIT